MKISDAYLKIAIGANLTPEKTNLSGATHVGLNLLCQRPAATGVLVARFYFSAAAQTAQINPTGGLITLSAGGVAQQCTRWVTAAGGVTASGNLTVTVTGVKLGGTLVLTVPVTLGQTAAQVAAAIAAKMAVTSGITDYFRASATADKIQLESLYGFADDATLNISITTALGVSNGVASALAGALGVLFERPGGAGNDIFGSPWVSGGVLDLVLTGHAPGPSYVTGVGIAAAVRAGVTAAVSYSEAQLTNQTLTAAGVAIVDLIMTTGQIS